MEHEDGACVLVILLARGVVGIHLAIFPLVCGGRHAGSGMLTPPKKSSTSTAPPPMKKVTFKTVTVTVTNAGTEEPLTFLGIEQTAAAAAAAGGGDGDGGGGGGGTRCTKSFGSPGCCSTTSRSEHKEKRKEKEKEKTCS